MKITEQTIFYSLLRNGRWDIHAPIWKFEGSAINYCDKEAEAYSWTKNPLFKSEFESRKFEVVEIDVSKLKVIYQAESKDLRKRKQKTKKCKIPNWERIENEKK